MPVKRAAEDRFLGWWGRSPSALEAGSIDYLLKEVSRKAGRKKFSQSMTKWPYILGNKGKEKSGVLKQSVVMLSVHSCINESIFLDWALTFLLVHTFKRKPVFKYK